MTQKLNSTQDGVLKNETIEPRQGTQSTNAASPFTSDTSATTAKAKSQRDSQLTPNSQENPNTIHVRMIMAFVSKLGELVQVRNVTLADGRKGWMIFFPSANFEIDPVSKSLRRR